MITTKHGRIIFTARKSSIMYRDNISYIRAITDLNFVKISKLFDHFKTRLTLPPAFYDHLQKTNNHSKWV